MNEPTLRWLSSLLFRLNTALKPINVRVGYPSPQKFSWHCNSKKINEFNSTPQQVCAHTTKQ